MKTTGLVLLCIIYFLVILINLIGITMLIRELNLLDRIDYFSFKNKYYLNKLVRAKEFNLENERISLKDSKKVLVYNTCILTISLIYLFLVLNEFIFKFIDCLTHFVSKKKCDRLICYRFLAYLACISYLFCYHFDRSIYFLIKLIVSTVMFYLYRDIIIPSSEIKIGYLGTFCSVFLISIFFYYLKTFLFVLKYLRSEIKGSIPIIPYYFARIYFDKIYFYESKEDIVVFNVTFFKTRRLFFVGNFNKFSEKELISLIFHEAGHTGIKDGRFIILVLGLITAFTVLFLFYLSKMIFKSSEQKNKLNFIFLIIVFPLIYNLINLMTNVFMIKIEEMTNLYVIANNYTKFFIDAQFKGNNFNMIPNKVPYLVNVLLYDHPSTFKLIENFNIK